VREKFHGLVTGKTFSIERPIIGVNDVCLGEVFSLDFEERKTTLEDK